MSDEGGDCCIASDRALKLMCKWYYLDLDGIRHGPFASFTVLYYIYSSYFEEETLFSRQDLVSPSYNSLVNVIGEIINDVEIHGQDVFSCTHFMNKLMKDKRDSTSHSKELHFITSFESPGEPASMKPDIASDDKSEYCTVSSVAISRNLGEVEEEPPAGRDNTPQHCSDYQGKSTLDSSMNMDYELSIQQSILQKRIESNFKEAETHLSRIHTRKISHVLERTLNFGSLSSNNT